MAERVVQTCCCCCAPSLHLCIVTCNIISVILFKLHEIWLVAILEIVIIVATRCQILWLKCTKFDFGGGSARDPAGGAYSAPQTP